jgi:hypothetical protein
MCATPPVGIQPCIRKSERTKQTHAVTHVETYPRFPHRHFVGDTRCDWFHRALQLSFRGVELVGQKGVCQVYAAKVQEDHSRTTDQDSRGHGPPCLSSGIDGRAEKEAKQHNIRRDGLGFSPLGAYMCCFVGQRQTMRLGA